MEGGNNPMKAFMDENFLLSTKTAQRLYHEVAVQEPIFDYHCHLIVGQIAENKRFFDLADMWLGGDHYKWRAMRTAGIAQEFITGDADPYDKFLAWAKTMPFLLGNPLYHWSHLELQRYFGITEVLNEKSAKRIWERTQEVFQTEEFSVSRIFKKFHVVAVGTTDDPADDLSFHCAVNAGDAPIGPIETKILPTYRPDKALLPQLPSFASYIERLGKASGIPIHSVDDVCTALAKRLDYFSERGCKAADHGIPTIPYRIADDKEVAVTFEKALHQHPLTAAQIEAYQTKVLLFLGKEYAKHNIVMQLHLNSLRNLNTRMFEKLGADTGFDACDDSPLAQKLASFLNALEMEQLLPKTILYTLNPKDYPVLATVMGSFQGSEIPGKMQLGSSWWFCDHKDGMEEQMRLLANIGSLPLFVGMLTDSRSFLSYPRHEYFRRILCNMLGDWAEEGQIPLDAQLLDTVVRDICFWNAQRYFA